MAAAKKKTTARKTAKKRARKKPRKKMGRPLFVVEWDKVDAMAAIDCTQEEIASVLGCDIATLNRASKRERKITFAEYLGQKRLAGNVSLRRAQWKKAVEERDKTLLIWLGKQRLGQRQNPEWGDEDLVSSEAFVVRIGRSDNSGSGVE